MISPERLRRFPHCGGAPDEMLKQVPMLGKERNFKAGERLFEEGNPATHLLMLEAGEVDIAYTLANTGPGARRRGGGILLSWASGRRPDRLAPSGGAGGEGNLIEAEAEPRRKGNRGNPEYGFM